MTVRVAIVTGASERRNAGKWLAGIAVDVRGGFRNLPYQPSTKADLAETAKRVEALDRRILTRVVDVADGVRELGRRDVVCANAGVAGFKTGSGTCPRTSDKRRSR